MQDKDEKSDRAEKPLTPAYETAGQVDSAHSAGQNAEREDAQAVSEMSKSGPASFPVIAIGASAGGLEALESFFSALPTESGMAFVVITHTYPGHESLLPGIILRGSRVPVKVIEDGMRMEKNFIFTPPSAHYAVLEGGVFRLKVRQENLEPHMPIDLFLKSLAGEKQEWAACVILSGTGSDGSQGLRVIKEKGGLAIAQNQGSAQHGGMPASAEETGLVDYVLDPSEMPGKLTEYFSSLPGSLLPSRGRMGEQSARLRHILSFLEHRTQHDFSLYKDSTLIRRIERRMAVTRSQNPEEYLSILHDNPSETRNLYQELLIGVTSFFRDPEAFSFLKEEVLPGLFSRKREGEVFRAWITGCSTGEEAYSVAMLIQECLEATNPTLGVQIFGTDIDKKAIERARRGIYLQNIMADVDSEQITRFFEFEGDQYRIKREIRERVVFAVQNVLRDPPFSNLDLLVCRNLLIYLKPEAQRKLVPLFHFTLRNEGVLFLGKSESVSRFPELFEPLSKQFNIYGKRKPGIYTQLLIPTCTIGPTEEAEMDRSQKSDRGEVLSSAQAAERVLLKEYTPAAVIVNLDYDIVHFHGHTGKYLESAPGRPSLRIVDMAREGLRFPLLSALRRAAEQNAEIREEGVQVKDDGGFHRVDLSVRRLSEPPLSGCMIVVFEDAPARGQEAGESLRQEATGEEEAMVNKLQDELARVGRDYQKALEELETTNEELKSLNEEVQSSNEALQSANEELASSKEELQSLNEELTVANDELNRKIFEFDEEHNIISDVLDRAGVAIVFLDKDRHVMRFTSSAARLTNLIRSDVGRPLEQISNNLEIGNLTEIIRQVQNTMNSFAQEVRTKDGHCYQMQIMVHPTAEGLSPGVVLTFVNIDAQKIAKENRE